MRVRKQDHMGKGIMGRMLFVNVRCRKLNKPPRNVAHKRKEAHKSLIIAPIQVAF